MDDVKDIDGDCTIANHDMLSGSGLTAINATHEATYLDAGQSRLARDGDRPEVSGRQLRLCGGTYERGQAEDDGQCRSEEGSHWHHPNLRLER
jgi:hypothetical protein